LFADVNFSENRSQSCATCHNPDHAFIDNRLNADGEIPAVSLGDDELSLGDRNTPSAAYAMFSPPFGQSSHARFNSQQGDYTGFVGGQFWDGRATNLAAQAEAPPTNPIEMGLADKATAVMRLEENDDYVAALKRLYGSTIFDNTELAYAAMADSIGEFEKTPEFAPFDSLYDLSLKGEYQYDPLSKAAQGKALFFSQQFTNCATCHQLHANSHKQELFTNFEYHNIGVPANVDIRAVNGKGEDFIDEGLFENGAVSDRGEVGKFKVPSLRNVAVTEPYMHNGVFRDLKTVIEFYDHFLTDSVHTLNPETGLAWREPEVSETVALTELEDGNKLSAEEVEALVCFLRTLTDSRYQHLIEAKGIDCGD
jgi:Cytochrome c peroxidase